MGKHFDTNQQPKMFSVYARLFMHRTICLSYLSCVLSKLRFAPIFSQKMLSVVSSIYYYVIIQVPKSCVALS